jgi:parvulin-like peptidyl-prolyl isomerase
MPSRLHLLVLIAIIGGAVSGCRSSPVDEQYVVRLGDQYLSQEELTMQLSSLPFTDDSLEARSQIIEQWVTNQLLYQEARRSGLRNDRTVQRMLEENERSVLVSAFLSQMYDTEEPEFDVAEIGAYYDRNRERLRLREPFVHVRHLSVESAAAAATARTSMAALDADDDRAWDALARQYSTDPDDAVALASTYVAESRLFGAQPALRSALAATSAGQVAGPIEVDGRFHLIQVLDRVQTGTIPELPWIEDEVQRRLLIEARKQMYARQVQRLRNEALAREDLEIR